jgi:signal transduction histidine kinase
MCVEGMLRDLPEQHDGGRLRDNATIAREQILRCRGITQHFLRMARGQTSQGDIVDAGEALDAVQRLIAPTARSHSVTIDVAPAPAGLHIRAGEAEFQNALINLTLNAVQACRPGGRVSVKMEGGEQLRIHVADNGCGIAPENLRRIFEPFFSLRQGGTGLGLFLTLNSVRRWGGDIHVESAAGEGSTFEILLPLLAEATAS